ncbi:unnamed protein product, partial [Didymodactylos carnosus]
IGEAIKSIKDDKMTINEASAKYNVPISTLYNRLSGHNGSSPRGGTAILSKEEEKFCGKLFTQNAARFSRKLKNPHRFSTLWEIIENAAFSGKLENPRRFDTFWALLIENAARFSRNLENPHHAST